jgi:hypothetical protein
MHDLTIHDATLRNLTHLLAVDVDAVGGCRRAGREPALGVLVVKWPRWNDDEEGEGGAGEANVQRQGNVLLGEADEEGDDLEGAVSSSLEAVTVTVTVTVTRRGGVNVRRQRQVAQW